MKSDELKISNTRGVSLINLAGLCYVLGTQKIPLSVKALANEAIRQGILNFPSIPTGARLPTRIHHHMIALRKLDLVTDRRSKGHVFYQLDSLGQQLFQDILSKYQMPPTQMDAFLRGVWRETLVSSQYVRYHWLRYFMDSDDFTYNQLISSSSPITFRRLPVEERLDPQKDSGYRLISAHWQERILDALDYREIYQGLHRWTNEVYLTDDRIPAGLDVPYLYQLEGSDVFKIEAHVVGSWLNPSTDLVVFEKLVDRFFDNRATNRVTIPELIIHLCATHRYSKYNVRELLVTLFYGRNKRFFFERGSEFLVHRAFDVARPEDYYVQIEGIWRTSLVRSNP